MSRKTKSGVFLTKLCVKGFLRCTQMADNAFDCEYQLMPLGEYAAEWGECDLNPAVYSNDKNPNFNQKFTMKGTLTGRTQAKMPNHKNLATRQGKVKR